MSFKILASMFCNFGRNFTSWFTLAATASLKLMLDSKTLASVRNAVIKMKTSGRSQVVFVHLPLLSLLTDNVFRVLFP